MHHAPLPKHISLFQSTHPVRGATNYLGVREILQPISIHAPREGCDGRYRHKRVPHTRFQSTHPVRGATAILGKYGLDCLISIHAPREGCDAT